MSWSLDPKLTHCVPACVLLQVRGAKLLLTGIKSQLQSQSAVRLFAANQGVTCEDLWLLKQTGKCI